MAEESVGANGRAPLIGGISDRMVIKEDMVELYINDYLMNLKRLHCDGHIGFFGINHTKKFQQLKVWQSI